MAERSSREESRQCWIASASPAEVAALFWRADSHLGSETCPERRSLYTQKRTFGCGAISAALGHELPRALRESSEPFCHQTIVKSVTDPLIGAWYSSPHCSGHDPVGGGLNDNRYRTAAIHIRARRRATKNDGATRKPAKAKAPEFYSGASIASRPRQLHDRVCRH